MRTAGDLPAVSSGRIYEDGGFRYFLQVYECAKETRAKGKRSGNGSICRSQSYDAFVCTWHYFLKDLEQVIGERYVRSGSEDRGLYLIKQFYLLPYNKEEEFYPQFDERMAGAKEGSGWISCNENAENLSMEDKTGSPVY